MVSFWKKQLGPYFLLQYSYLNSEPAELIFWGYYSVQTKWHYVCSSLPPWKTPTVRFLFLALLLHNVFSYHKFCCYINWDNVEGLSTIGKVSKKWNSKSPIFFSLLNKVWQIILRFNWTNSNDSGIQWHIWGCSLPELKMSHRL